MRLSYDTIYQELLRVLIKHGFSGESAEMCARLFTETSQDGVYSHGINRFPRFIQYIQDGFVQVDAHPKLTYSFGSMEQWDGCLGPGNLNAWHCMNRAIHLAKIHGMGLVALKNTNHWMRGGTYGWQAAENGFLAICATNTIPNMPAWGAITPTLGNNPLILAIPREKGPIVYDAAMTQFSFGKIELFARTNRQLPVVGGFDQKGEVTKDPKEIEATGRALPMGFWKGSGLSLMLDLMVSILSSGLSTLQIGAQHETEYGLSQFFFVIDPLRMGNQQHIFSVVESTIKAMHDAEPVDSETPIYYPGERTLKTRMENKKLGIPIDEDYWKQIQNM